MQITLQSIAKDEKNKLMLFEAVVDNNFIYIYIYAYCATCHSTRGERQGKHKHSQTGLANRRCVGFQKVRFHDNEEFDKQMPRI